ncbi:MAG: helix-turn-helix domain-containing protein [Actinomycetota bacterium]
MKGGLLIKEARRRAGLTQKELANRLGTSQSVVARWEGNTRSPTLETVTRAVRACGFDLNVSMPRYDNDHDIGLAHMWRRFSPTRRVQELENMLELERYLHGAGRPNA